ncbi:hypothetical protein B7C42_06051 [Nocardia cerradoensis]|uniref:Uncharacterized protein n=1 Tax=Nocardia cerradoensis TaxID=85688 RepID=A0A231GYN7_9NOCA|nr:hypothetical protein B7C42_06051 [Nocardia cerradoensis]
MVRCRADPVGTGVDRTGGADEVRARAGSARRGAGSQGCRPIPFPQHPAAPDDDRRRGARPVGIAGELRTVRETRWSGSHRRGGRHPRADRHHRHITRIAEVAHRERRRCSRRGRSLTHHRPRRHRRLPGRYRPGGAGLRPHRSRRTGDPCRWRARTGRADRAGQGFCRRDRCDPARQDRLGRIPNSPKELPGIPGRRARPPPWEREPRRRGCDGPVTMDETRPVRRRAFRFQHTAGEHTGRRVRGLQTA